MKLLVSWVIMAAGVALAAWMIPGIDYRDGNTLMLVVIVLGFFNAFLRPLLVVFALPFVVATLGLGLWLINALLLLGAGAIVEGFHVSGFGSALLGALVISITGFFLNTALRVRVVTARKPKSQGRARADGDVIDI